MYLCEKLNDMQKKFNIGGACFADKHYMLPSAERINEIYKLINSGEYFTIHSSRQSGKTTFLLNLVDDINNEGKFYAVYCSLEKAQNIDDAKEGIQRIHNILEYCFEMKGIFNHDAFITNIKFDDYINLLERSLVKLTRSLDKPLVILFDEADCLSYNVLIPFLRQLRSGFLTRNMYNFVHSIGLIGMRRIKDYKADVRPDSASSGTSSPFNISSGNFTLKNFTLEEVSRLYYQHTEATGQKFTKEAIAKAHYYSGGHPWLVNALARECVDGIHKGVYKDDVTVEHMIQSSQTLILRRDTHFDSLLERLKENRVRRVVEPMILGGIDDYDWEEDDFQYVMDLGILKNVKGTISPANPIYKEIIIRTLSKTTQSKLDESLTNKWLSPEGIDMNHLLKEFQQFWRENSDIWVERFQYKEAAPHLILQAFLQRVINGGGYIHREYASGRKRLDLCVEYEGKKYPIELKLNYGEKTLKDGLVQLTEYMDFFGQSEGWLIIFDRKSDKSWDEKIYWNTHMNNGKTIHVLGG